MNEINIDSVSERFQQHLDIENNFRIIFSGKYGIGKTFFLNDFFDKRKDNYNKIVISPVNYAISSNENIFELIKADILKDIFLTGKIDLKKLADDNLLQKISKYIENNPLTIPHFLLKNLAKLNPLIETPVKIIEGIVKIISDYKKSSKVKTDADKTLNEEVAEYLSGHEEIIGSIYEHNYITKAINVFLNEIRGDKKNVLIIDDMDRIDPEHLFRILNILSAHNNHFDTENKFAFDHVILVCDIDNVSKIYQHRYGKNVDFEGYIDKFFSTDLFHFGNKEAIITYLKENPLFNSSDVESRYFLLYLMEELVQNNFLTVRKLIKSQIDFSVNEFEFDRYDKLSTQTFHIQPQFVANGQELYVSSSDVHIFHVFKMLSLIFGDFKNFENAIESLSKVDGQIEIKNELISVLKYILLQKHILECEGLDKYVSYDHFNNGDILERIANTDRWPSVIWGDMKFQIWLKWNRGKPYDGTESYFNNAKTLIERDGLEVDTFSYKMIFNLIKEVISHAKRKKLIEKIPISGM